MPPPLLIRGARQLLTLRGAIEPRRGSQMQNLAVIPDGSLLLDGPLIEEAGSSRRILNLAKARSAESIDASGCLVLPGFVDPCADSTKRSARFLEYGTTAIGCTHVSRKRHSAARKSNLGAVDLVPPPPSPNPIEVLLPVPSFFAPPSQSSVRAKIGQGRPLALASGFDGIENHTFSMQAVLALACRILQMTPAEAITATTTNAAHALGLGTTLGALEPGMQADILLLDVPDYNEIPYHLGENLVKMVIKRGRIAYQRGEPAWVNP